MSLHNSWQDIWFDEQKASLERISRNFRMAFTLLPMGIIEALVNLLLFLSLCPFIFARGLDTLISRAVILYKAANKDEIIKSYSRRKWPITMTKSEQIANHFSVKEDKFTLEFISKIVPFIAGVLSTLLTLFFTNKLIH